MAFNLPYSAQSKPFYMKRLSIFSLIALFTTASLQAQVTTSFGFKAGANQNTFYLKQEGSSEVRYTLTKPGFHVGGIVDIGCSSNFSIQPQLLLVSKGGKINLGSQETTFDFLTIDLPINFLYHYNGFFLGGGPNLSYGVSGKGKATGDPDVDLYDEGLGSTGKFKRFEVGVNATMGFRFPSGFMVSTNFTPGLTDIFEEASGVTEDITSHNSFFGFSVGYLFGGSGKAKK
jgi:hypothetical protein